MDRRCHRGFGFPWIDNNDGWISRILHNALPHDWMRDARVRSDKDERVRLLEISVSIRRRVESERLLVGNMGGCHALAGSAIALAASHTHHGEAPPARSFLASPIG